MITLYSLQKYDIYNDHTSPPYSSLCHSAQYYPPIELGCCKTIYWGCGSPALLRFHWNILKVLNHVAMKPYATKTQGDRHIFHHHFGTKHVSGTILFWHVECSFSKLEKPWKIHTDWMWEISHVSYILNLRQKRGLIAKCWHLWMIGQVEAWISSITILKTEKAVHIIVQKGLSLFEPFYDSLDDWNGESRVKTPRSTSSRYETCVKHFTSITKAKAPVTRTPLVRIQVWTKTFQANHRALVVWDPKGKEHLWSKPLLLPRKSKTRSVTFLSSQLQVSRWIRHSRVQMFWPPFMNDPVKKLYSMRY